ncbi:MAG: hypothetical protein REJ50_25470, partial [Bordetella sp.]|nr:hypothetical protein [Bordetella sp.]
GAWMLACLRVLARFKRLRGTPLDVFGYTQERRTERALLRDFESLIEAVLPRLTAANIALAAEIARLPEKIRGFGHVKDRNIDAYCKELAALRARWEA